MVHPSPSGVPHRSARFRRSVLLGVGAVLVGLALAGCEAPPPTITWYGNGTAVNAGPALYCELTAEAAPACTETDGPTARLALEPGDPLQVNIPGEIAEQPWVLVWNYSDSASTGVSERSPVSTDGHTLSYVIRPGDDQQLQQVDLQVLTIVAGETLAEYAPLSVWRLQVDPA